MNKKRILSIGVSVVLLGAVFWFMLPKMPDFSKVWGEISAMTPLELVILAVVAAWNLTTYWIALAAATPGLRYRQAMVVKASATAVSTSIPGGGAIAVGLSYAMFRSWGYSKSRTSVSLVVASIWNNFVRLGLPVLALVLLALQGDASGTRVVAGIGGSVALVAATAVFVLVLRSERFAFRTGEVVGRVLSRLLAVIHRPPLVESGETTVKFRGRVVGLVERSWAKLTVTAVVNHLSLFLVLLVALRAIGVSDDEVGWAQVLAVFAFVRLLTAVPLTPGGIGFVELGLIGGLTSAGGDRPAVVAAVLVYRLLTYVVPIGFGALTYLFWRRNTSWRTTPTVVAPSAAVPVLVG